jgi:hypothetical protein
MAKAAFKNKKALFTSKLDLNLTKKLVKFYILNIAFLWCWNVDTSESSNRNTSKFWNMVREKDGEDQLDRSCEKWGKEHPTYNKTKEA